MKINKQLQTILEGIDPKQEIFTEEVLGKLSATIDTRAQEIYEERINSEREKIYIDTLTTIDEDHTKKVEEILEAIDIDHTKKMEEIVTLVEEKCKNKKIDEQIVDTVNDYLETFLESAMPETTMVDKVKLERLEKLFAESRELFMVSDDFIQTEVGEALIEAKTKIQTQQKELNKLMLEKTQLVMESKKYEAQTVLESSIEHLTESEKVYLRKHFKGVTDVSEISGESINEALTAFKEDELINRQPTQPKSDIANRFIVEEHHDDNQPTDPIVSQWVNLIERSKYKK